GSTWSAASTRWSGRQRRWPKRPDSRRGCPHPSPLPQAGEGEMEEKHAMTTIRCDIVSAEAEIFRGEATMVVVTGEVGELGIAPRHAPLITRLKPGKVVVTQANGEKLDFAISGGI